MCNPMSQMTSVKARQANALFASCDQIHDTAVIDVVAESRKQKAQPS